MPNTYRTRVVLPDFTIHPYAAEMCFYGLRKNIEWEKRNKIV